ncbi:hypothetical protein LJB99_04005 [Deltaproteobacteria bacterium OttesenSCG-928-K17]|nr:hypothetical protein [Deltaproteobacteria bacterium OttesenSCG-928-K17]
MEPKFIFCVVMSFKKLVAVMGTYWGEGVLTPYPQTPTPTRAAALDPPG